MNKPVCSARGCSTGLQVRVLSSLGEIEGIRKTWSAMQWHPNADIDFYSLIVSIRPEVIHPYVLEVSRDGKPIALVAGRLETGAFELEVGYKVLCRFRVRRLSMITGGYMGDMGDEVSKAIVERLLQSVLETRADMLVCSGVDWGSPLRRYLGELVSTWCRDHLTRPSEHWSMAVPKSLQHFLEHKMSKKHRYWARRTMRFLETDFCGAVRHACFARPEEVETLFAHVLAIARKSYQWGLGVGFQDSEENHQRLLYDAKRGVLRGYVLYLKEVPVAFWLCTLYKDTLHLDFTGYDPQFRKYEVGTVLFLEMVGQLSEQGVQRLDFGVGSAAYKKRFADGCIIETTVFAFSPTLKSVSLNILRWGTEGISQRIQQVLVRLNLERIVKRIWRALATPSSIEDRHRAGAG